MNSAPAPLISALDYRLLREFLREQMGYALEDGKEYLVESRLAPIAASFGLSDPGELIRRLQQTGECGTGSASGTRAMREAVVEAMTINETYFFRTPRVFENLRRVMIPTLMAARGAERRLRLWCAGCATGQEPYSIAMTIADHLPELDTWQVRLVATDISEAALQRARSGLYNQFEVQRGLPVHALVKHFTKVGDQWRVSDAIRQRVEFRRVNLLDGFAGLGGLFDVIFIRNVLIYLDRAVSRSIFGQLRQVIAPDGCLVLGEAETILGLTDAFTISPDAADCYRPANRVQ